MLRHLIYEHFIFKILNELGDACDFGTLLQPLPDLELLDKTFLLLFVLLLLKFTEHFDCNGLCCNFVSPDDYRRGQVLTIDHWLLMESILIHMRAVTLSP